MPRPSYYEFVKECEFLLTMKTVILRVKVQRYFSHGYYDRYCYPPFYVFRGDKLLVANLRPSNIDPAKHAWAILSLLYKRLKKEWPDVRIKEQQLGLFANKKEKRGHTTRSRMRELRKNLIVGERK